MSGITTNAPSSADACLSIVHSLMCHRQGGESEGFAKRAIESLVKKLKEKRDELDSLITAITTSGAHPSKCVTIQRTLDGRLQVAGRKGLTLQSGTPRLVKDEYTAGPVPGSSMEIDGEISMNVSQTIQHHPRNRIFLCQIFNLLQQLCMFFIIVVGDPGLYNTSNRPVLGPSTVPKIEGGPDTCSRSNWLPHMHLHPSVAVLQQHDIPGQNQVSSSTLNNQQQPGGSGTPIHVAPPGHNSQQFYTTQTSGVPDRPSQEAITQNIVFCTASNSPVSPHLQQNGFSNSTSTGVAANTSGSVSGTQPTPTMGQAFTGAGGTWTGSNTLTYTQSMQPPDRNHHTAYWNHSSSNQIGSEVNIAGLLSSQPAPEYWCSVAYFELDSQVGETFKVPSNCPNVTIDGYVDPSGGNRFCLGALSNVHRTEQSERARLHIGKGVQLDLRGGRGRVATMFK
ncbi:hypothetical protein NQ314_017192 [Rhamnusium bicolor]|uniref:Mothers against decapentaplegic homolog n=1 Tax=Rhamnusium bicolor TaxID=1586634 RepID=A0AAV8WV34_9CUCU|nr:hypothetical protein NQ314_017192 [Rhamnusium bicolor]